MHAIVCPVCMTRIEVDFKPTAGLVWCPKCEKTFAPIESSGPGRDAERMKSDNGCDPSVRDES